MKKVLVLFLLVFLVGCSNNTEVKEELKEIVETKEEVSSINRIISTAPSNTEVIVGLGLGDKIVAVDNFSDKSEIPNDVVLMDMMAPNMELIMSLEPDVIITSNLNSEGGSPFDQIIDLGYNVVNIETANSIEDIYSSIEAIGIAVEKEEESKIMVKNLREEIEEIREKSKQIEERKKVYFELGNFSGSLYSLGNGTYIDEIISVVGGENIFHDQESWIVVSGESVVDKDPEIIVTSSSMADSVAEEIKTREGFSEVEAIKNDRVHVLKTSNLSRGSQKVIIGIRELAEVMYPNVYK